MPNEENLKLFDSVEKARENGKKGGKKSGESKRQKKTLKSILTTLLELKPTKGVLSAVKDVADLTGDVTNMDAYIAAMYGNALKGNAKAIETINRLLDDREKEARIRQLEAETNLTNAKLNALSNAQSVDVEDLKPLADLLAIGSMDNDEDGND